ncbi:prosalusin [Bombina bombina]|uniref:prosalusin n=1 Tax=Bombina bombina TaxID=8345 RepID=UPI00235AA501|nr:prosalusin [Bombina bombina]
MATCCLLQFVLVVAVSGWELPALPCSLYSRCECDFQPDLLALDCDFARNVFGQHLARELLVKALTDFLETEEPSKPLVLSFHGWSGTGKTLVSSLLVNHLFRDGSRSPHVHRFSPILHFPHIDRIKSYKEDLRHWIQGNLTACGRSLFLFEEMDKMPPGLIDEIVPFLGPDWVVYGSNYRKAIFLFISNAGGEDINRVAFEAWQNRKDREEIQLRDVESIISNSVISNRNHGFWNSEIIHGNLIDVVVPFLPLRPSHVKQCIRNEMKQQGIEPEEDIVRSIAENLIYFPEGEHVFSSTGCKTVASRISYFL